MKRILLLAAALIVFFITAQAQNKNSPVLSAYTKQYLALQKKGGSGQQSTPGYVYKTINGQHYISAFIKVGDIDQSVLDNLGVFVGTKAGKVWTVQVPVDNINAFTQVAGINYIDLDMPVFPYLDSARKETRADSAQKGIGLPLPATGKNVITGIIDAGFDYNHPTMYDTTYSKYRIQRVWQQKAQGTPPSGFAYGNELTDTNMIKTAAYDTAILSHGTHVTGIAAGSGYGSNNNNRFRGFAFESDIVLVAIMPAPSEWAVAGESDIIDGMSYIYNYAASVGKPAVINLSWGATIGPHDGNSLFSQACDALTGPGKIFVCAAGNNGEDTVHLGKTFSPTDTAVSTFVTFSPYLDTAHKQTWVDVWGDTGSSFCVSLKLYNGNAATDSTHTLCLADTAESFTLVGSDGKSCYVTLSMTPSEYNNKPHALLYFYTHTKDNLCLTTTSANANVNMWEGYVLPPEGYYGYLEKLGYPWAVNGDSRMTVSDIGCTRSAITTAAYISKTAFINTDNQSLYYPGAVHGRIAPFSSLGPTEDGRIKPDIAAPGFALASSVSSFDTSYSTGGTNVQTIVHADMLNGRTYNYAMLAGTSMASPCATGIVAMMLQMAPTLTPDSVKALINSNAIKDNFTGSIPDEGNTTWGHGKINAYGAIRAVAANLSVSNTLSNDPLQCILYPNPNNGGFTILYRSDVHELLTVTISDVTGRTIHTAYWMVNVGSNSHQFSTGNIAKGVYLVKVAGANGSNVIKMQVE